MTDWSRLVEEIKPYIVKIETPHGSGTGFQIGEDAKWAYAITVTAHHVIAFAEEWRLPIKITRETPSESLELPPAAPGGSRIRRTRQDASSLFLPVKRHLPQITLHPASLPVGTEVGWLGYPGSVSGGKLAFFSGRISVVLHEERNYLLDGVVLPGVSGGPVFTERDGRIAIVGLVTSHIPNSVDVLGVGAALNVSVLWDSPPPQG